MPLSNEVKTKSNVATSESSVTPKQSQMGFLPTKALGEPETTTNARLVVTFAEKLGALVTWKKLELADGTEVIALCFPTNAWTTNAANELVVKEKEVR
jgi:hypothetical protein